MGLDAFQYPALLVAAALAHSLWQATVLIAAIRVWERRWDCDPRWRYRILAGALVISCALPVITAVTAHDSMFGAAVVSEAANRHHADPGPTGWIADNARRLTLAAVAVWAAGAIGAFWRLAAGLLRLRALVAMASPTERSRELVESVAAGVTDRVRILEVAIGCSPFVAGLARPVLVVPRACFDRVPLDELRALIRHELAHVRRHDFAANLGQRLLECLAWFNPAVRALSASVSAAREERCDAAAAESPEEGLLLAKALIRLEETGQARLLVAPNGAAGPLGRRIRQLIERPANRPIGPIGTAGAAVLASGLVVAAIMCGRAAGATIRSTMPVARIQAEDLGGRFAASVLAGRLLAISIPSKAGHFEQRGRWARVIDPDGTTVLALRMTINGFSWSSRRPRPAPDKDPR